MKRKEFRDRTQVLLSVERDRWKDFIDICDKERKSTSFKFDEMLAEELQKNALGEHTPISVSYGNQEQKPFQTDLTPWLERVNTIESQKELLVLKGQGSTLMKRVDQRSKELYLQGIRQ